MKPIFTLFVRACFVVCAIFGVAAVALLLAALLLWSRPLLVWATVCGGSAIGLWMAAFFAMAVKEDCD